MSVCAPLENTEHASTLQIDAAYCRFGSAVHNVFFATSDELNKAGSYNMIFLRGCLCTAYVHVSAWRIIAGSQLMNNNILTQWNHIRCHQSHTGEWRSVLVLMICCFRRSVKVRWRCNIWSCSSWCAREDLPIGGGIAWCLFSLIRKGLQAPPDSKGFTMMSWPRSPFCVGGRRVHCAVLLIHTKLNDGPTF